MDGLDAMKTETKSSTNPEIPAYTKYYEHDGMLRAYANRAMFLAMLFGVIASVRWGSRSMFESSRRRSSASIKMAMRRWWARERERSGVQAGHGALGRSSRRSVSNSAAPTDLEGRAVLRRFLQHYLSYTPDSVTRNLAESLNMMTTNLRKLTMDKLRDDDTIGKIQQDQIISDFRIRSIERSKDAPGVTWCSA